jgi:hypothetical protein
MARQEATVWIKPTPELEQMLRRVLRDQGRPAPRSPNVDPIVIDTPDGRRSMWVDETGESHWVMSGLVPLDKPTWRQAWVIREETA